MKRRSYRTPLSDSCPTRIDAANLAKMLDRARNGDVNAKKTLVEGHMRLAMALVTHYDHRNITDDLVGAALYGLCRGVDKISMETPTHDNLGAFLAMYIHGEIKLWLRKRNVVITNLDPQAPKCFDLHSDRHVGGVPDTSLDDREFIESLARDDIDHLILSRMLVEFTQREIAEELCITEAMVSKRLTKIKGRCNV